MSFAVTLVLALTQMAGIRLSADLTVFVLNIHVLYNLTSAFHEDYNYSTFI